MAGFDKLLNQSDAADIEFLFAQLQRGLALLDVADLTSNHETSREVTAGAVKIYRSVVQLCSSPKQETALHQRLELLRTRLAMAGYYTLFLPDSLARCLTAIRT